MAMTDERAAERALAERGKAVDAALSAIRLQNHRAGGTALGQKRADDELGGTR